VIVQFIETSNDFNHGKFMLARLDAAELRARSALPGYEESSLWHLGGLRAFNKHTTLVFDLQTGEGATFTLARHGSPSADLTKHKIWVCPMFEPFLHWLYAQGLDHGAGDIAALPRFVELSMADGAAFQGYRRPGPDEQES
jgi:hypothetical protein